MLESSETEPEPVYVMIHLLGTLQASVYGLFVTLVLSSYVTGSVRSFSDIFAPLRSIDRELLIDPLPPGGISYTMIF